MATRSKNLLQCLASVVSFPALLLNAMKSILILFLLCAFSSIDLFGFEHGGFSLDETILKSKTDRETVEEIFKEQVDVVNTVSLPADMLAIIHSLPINVVEGIGLETYEEAYAHQPFIFFSNSYINFNADIPLSQKHPMYKTSLLHECMHAIHDLYPPGFF